MQGLSFTCTCVLRLFKNINLYQIAKTCIKVKKQHIPSHRSFGLSRLSVSLAAHILLKQITAEFKHFSRDFYALTSMFKHVQQWIYSETPAARKMTQQIKCCFNSGISIQCSIIKGNRTFPSVPFPSAQWNWKKIPLTSALPWKRHPLNERENEN